MENQLQYLMSHVRVPRNHLEPWTVRTPLRAFKSTFVGSRKASFPKIAVVSLTIPEGALIVLPVHSEGRLRLRQLMEYSGVGNTNYPGYSRIKLRANRAIVERIVAFRNQIKSDTTIRYSNWISPSLWKDVKSSKSHWDNEFQYTVGKELHVQPFDHSRQSECARGIHFFLTAGEAVDYYC